MLNTENKKVQNRKVEIKATFFRRVKKKWTRNHNQEARQKDETGRILAVRQDDRRKGTELTASKEK